MALIGGFWVVYFLWCCGLSEFCLYSSSFRVGSWNVPVLATGLFFLCVESATAVKGFIILAGMRSCCAVLLALWFMVVSWDGIDIWVSWVFLQYCRWCSWVPWRERRCSSLRECWYVLALDWGFSRCVMKEPDVILRDGELVIRLFVMNGLSGADALRLRMMVMVRCMIKLSFAIVLFLGSIASI